MNIGISRGTFLQNSPFAGTMLKSTQEKMQRQQECDHKVAFYENSIAMLKNTEADSLEDISRKLEMLHSYQDSIAAAKQEYNNQQMRHVMDEAIERGEKIAEASEDMEPKTPEERREEMRKEALGMEEEGLLESMEEIAELPEEIGEELLDDAEELPDEVSGKLSDDAEELPDELSGKLSDDAMELPDERNEAACGNIGELPENLSDSAKTEHVFLYKPFDSYA